MADIVTVKTTMNFKPWQVPNFAVIDMGPVTRQLGAKESPSIALADLDNDVLDELAAAWLAELYRKHGTTCPFYRTKAAA